jgi:gamma-glutamylcyclotransferase (GGCT)/AIG2-like uncharacterized protein YtfP
MIKVFVYGTLKPGEMNDSLCDRWVIEACPAIAFGIIYQLPFGYPAMVAGGKSFVQGVLLSFADFAILQQLDEFEQHDPDLFQHYFPALPLDAYHYHRQAIATFNLEGTSLGSAWAYLMTFTQVQQLNGVLVPSGSWEGVKLERPN